VDDARIDKTTQRVLPGDAGFWSFIAADCVLFFLLFFQVSTDRAKHLGAFTRDQGTLLLGLGALNTVVLLTSSWFAALAVSAVRRGESSRAARLALATAGMGLVFTAVKAVEYTHAGNGHHTPASSLFFTYYFIVTGLHLLHLLVGAVAMTVMAWRLRAATSLELRRERVYFECVASYWHLVDVLWLFIFPLLYLVR
jgi:nitric oxide reductase NorE protein